MREIKFRIFDKGIPKDAGDTELEKPSGVIVNWDYLRKSDYFQLALDGHFPLMQYTGLKDKNGKEVYEGDIVTCPWHWSVPTLIEYPQCYYDLTEYQMQDDLTVIGNIYENPELLAPSSKG